MFEYGISNRKSMALGMAYVADTFLDARQEIAPVVWSDFKITFSTFSLRLPYTPCIEPFRENTRLPHPVIPHRKVHIQVHTCNDFTSEN